MPHPVVDVGPLKTQWGLVDARFDGAELTLTHYRTWLELVDRHRVSYFVIVVVTLLGGGYAHGPLRVASFSVAAVAFLVLVVLVVAQVGGAAFALVFALVSLLTPRGRAGLERGAQQAVAGRPQHAVVIGARDIRLVTRTDTTLHAELVLSLPQREVRLGCWRWRRRRLALLGEALDR